MKSKKKRSKEQLTPTKSTPPKGTKRARAPKAEARAATTRPAKARPASAVSPIPPIEPTELVKPAGRVVSARATPRLRKPIVLPSILLEGDAPPAELFSGPGERFVLGPTPPERRAKIDEQPQQLPEAYGTGRLFFAARDPHSLYLSWDLTTEQQHHYNSLSRAGHLVVRTYLDTVGANPASEIPVDANARSLFIPSVQAEQRYIAQLGWFDAGGVWKPIATSDATLTPPESVTSTAPVEFATVPLEVSLNSLLEPRLPTATGSVATDVLVAQASVAPIPPPPPATPEPQSTAPRPVDARPELSRAEAKGQPSIPPPPQIGPVVEPAYFRPPEQAGPSPTAAPWASSPAHSGIPPRPSLEKSAISALPPSPVPVWTEKQEAALSEMIQSAGLRLSGLSSIEVAELILRHLQAEITSGPPSVSEEAGLAAAPGRMASIPSSDTGPSDSSAGREKKFWLTVNAELVIYGATEPDARVVLGGRPIRLRPDGSFSYRFALPNGQYPLPIQAHSADGSDSRSARLQFSRDTELEGEVGRHPQDPALRAPDQATLV